MSANTESHALSAWAAFAELPLPDGGIHPDHGARFRELANNAGAPVVWLMEIDGVSRQQTEIIEAFGYASAAVGCFSLKGGESLSEGRLVSMSDAGHIGKTTDLDGVRFYPPYLASVMRLSRYLPVAPNATEGGMVGAAWGETEFFNPNGVMDDILEEISVEGAPVRFSVGGKSFDPIRGLWLDWPQETFIPVFSGRVKNTLLNDFGMTATLRDNTLEVERRWQDRFYSGNDGLTGSLDMTGKVMPRLRGTVRNLKPVLVDPRAHVYQYNDAPGEILTLYERALPGFSYEGDVSDLYEGYTSFGCYRTDNARGLFQLGVAPAGEITLDARGAFPSGDYVENIVDLFRLILTEDLSVLRSRLDLGSFASLAKERPWKGGYYAAEEVQAVAVLGALAGSFGGVAGVNRHGQFALYRLGMGSPEPVASYSEHNIFAVRPVALPEAVAPVLWRIAVIYARNYTLQAGDLPPDVDADHRQYVAAPEQGKSAFWANPEVRRHYPLARELSLSCVLSEREDAEALARVLAEIWGVPRLIYELEVGLSPLMHDIGDWVRVQFPVAGLRTGKTALVVGEETDTASQKVTLTVLV